MSSSVLQEKIKRCFDTFVTKVLMLFSIFRHIFTIVLWFVFISIVSFSEICFAKEKTDKTYNSVAIIDLKKVAIESEAGKYIEKRIAEINDLSKKDLLDLETKIKSMDTVKASESDARKIEDMQLILYDMIRTKRYQISEAYKKAITILESEIKKAVSYVSEQKGIRTVLASDAVIYKNNDCADITSQVIKRINETCREINVILNNE